MSSIEERLQAAATFLLQSPPGEANDCFNDVRAIVADDKTLEEGIQPALQQYNSEQFTVVQLQGQPVLITPASHFAKAAGKEGGKERHLDPRGQRSFLFDHLKSIATDPQPVHTDPETENHRSAIEKLLTSYVDNHYHDGVSQVYALDDANFPREPELDDVPANPEPPVNTDQSEPSTETETIPKEKAPEAEADVPTAKASGESKSDEALTPISKADDADEPNESGAETEAEGTAPLTTENGEEQKIGETEKEESSLEPAISNHPTEPEKHDTPNESTDVGMTEATLDNTEVHQSSRVRSPPLVKSRKFGLYFVGNKYNPNNFWTGRWRSCYTIDLAEGVLIGTAQINVHYYEQGNVQLSTTLHAETPLSPNPSPMQIIASLKTSEQSFQRHLSETYDKLSEDMFKGLRRALPKTRSKIDWAKVSGYRMGSELGRAIPGPQ